MLYIKESRTDILPAEEPTDFHSVLQMWLELILLAILAGILLFRWATKNNDYFEKRNLPYDKPAYLLGSGKDIVFGRKAVLHVLCELYNKQNDM